MTDPQVWIVERRTTRDNYFWCLTKSGRQPVLGSRGITTACGKKILPVVRRKGIPDCKKCREAYDRRSKRWRK